MYIHSEKYQKRARDFSFFPPSVCNAMIFATYVYIFVLPAWNGTAVLSSPSKRASTIKYPVDLKTRKSTGTSCQIEIHFSIQIITFLMKYNLLCF